MAGPIAKSYHALAYDDAVHCVCLRLTIAKTGISFADSKKSTIHYSHCIKLIPRFAKTVSANCTYAENFPLKINFLIQDKPHQLTKAVENYFHILLLYRCETTGRQN